MVDSQTVSPPRVGGVPASLECRLFQTVPLPRDDAGRGYVMVMGTVTGIYVDEAVIKDGKLDYTSYTPISRLGYRDYGRVTDIFQVARPDDK